MKLRITAMKNNLDSKRKKNDMHEKSKKKKSVKAIPVGSMIYRHEIMKTTVSGLLM